MPVISSGLGSIAYYGVPSVQAYSVKINNNAVFCLAGSLKIDLSVGRRSQASFIVHTDTNTHFYQYQQVKIFDHNGILVFSGYITNPKEQRMGFQKALIHTITCTDQHFLADKRIIQKVYSNMTVGAIVQDIVTTYLASEGVTLGTAGSGPSSTTTQIFDGLIPKTTLYPSTTLYPNGNVGVVSNTTFSYCTVAAALDSLVTEASSAGVQYYWAIDQNKRLFFQPYTASPNNLIVDGTWIDQKSNGATVQRQNVKYRNKQWLTGGVGQTPQKTETRTSDGKTTAWTMGYPLFSAPTVTVNGTGQTVGVKGATIPKGATPPAWTWAQGDPVITQETGNGAAVIVASQTLSFTYVGQFPSIVVAENDAQIKNQAAIDGTSGIIEAVDEDKTLTDVQTAVTEASRFLGQYAVPGTILTFTTLISGWIPGQLVTVNLPEHGLNNAQMLIETVTVTDSYDSFNMWYTVTAVIGPYDNTWVQFYAQLLATQQNATDITTGAQLTTTNVQTTSTSVVDAHIRFGLTSGPQPPTFSKTAAAIRFKLEVSGVITSASQAFTGSGPLFSANLTASTATVGTGGGSTGGGVTISGPLNVPTPGSFTPGNQKMYVFKFGDTANTTTGSAPGDTNSQYLMGTNLLLYWSNIEQSKGNRNWSVVENFITPWSSHNKKVILRVATAAHAGWAPPYSGQATPSWVYSEGVSKVTEADGSVYPQYWNSTFLNEWQAFITAMAAKYDGDPRIAYIQIGAGDGGEANPDTNTGFTLAKWQAIGYTDPVWRDTTFKIISFYTSAFKKTPLCWMGDKTYVGNSGAPYNEGNMILWCTGQSNGLGTSPFNPAGKLPRLWIQNNGIGTNSVPDPKWLLSTIGCEQLKKTAQTGDTLDQDMLAMQKYGATFALIFHGDIENSANGSTLAKYYRLS